MTEYAIQSVSKISGNESFKRFESKSKEHASISLRQKYGHSYYVGIFTKADFLRHAWNYGSGGSMIEHAHYEMVWKTAPYSMVSEESWQRNLGKPWRSLSKGFKEAFESVTWGHLQVLK